MTPFPGIVYKYLEITKGVVLEDELLKEITIRFKVLKDWLVEKGLTRTDMALYRYVDGSWERLPTTSLKETEEYINYSAESPGFSYFVIGAEVVEGAEVEEGGEGQEGQVEVIREETEEGLEEEGVSEEGVGKEKKKIWPWVLVVMVVIAGGIGSWFWYRKTKENKKKKKK